MLQFNVDRELCIQCGECAKDCPYMILDMVDGYPQVNDDRANQCIECQHCFAICPTAALSIFGLKPSDSIPLKDNLPDPAKMETLMMGRRSVRRYKDEPVDPALLERIMETVRMAPTGVNRRTTLFTLVENQDAMAELRRRTYAGLRKAVEEGTLPQGLEFFEGISNLYEEKGVDVLYRGAPHFIVTSAPKDGPSGMADGLIALSYFEILANSHGLGTVWDGLAKWALLNIAQDAGAMLDIPADHEVCYMMAFGKPAVRYHRTVQRPGGIVNKITV